MTAAALFAGACGHSWPSTTPAKADPAFAARQRPITTVDILPVDVEAWTQPGVKVSADDLRLMAEAGIIGATSDELLRRGYLVSNAIGWDGEFVRPDGLNAVALTPDALLATVDALSSYGLAVEKSHGLPVPYLPVRLGDATGADATLYIGGWTYQGKDTSRADKILKGVLIGIAIVGVIVVLAVIAKNADGLGNAAGGVARSAANAAVSVARVAGRVALKAGNATIQIGRGLADVSADVLDTTFRIADAWGRSANSTHITVFDTTSPRPPSWSERPEAPHKGHSRTYLELTLVDNRTGLVLWHARQQFPTHAGTDAKAQRIVHTLMTSLPAAGLDPLAEYHHPAAVVPYEQ
jgi:hypothetical protein